MTEVRLGDRSCRGVTNVGVKPTIEGKNPVGVETHLLDFAGDLYGKVVTVEFLTRIREERKFSSIEALKEEILHMRGHGSRKMNPKYYGNVT